MEVNDKEDYSSVDFLARFACLYEGVNLACDKAEQLGIDPNKSTSWIKPLAFQKYIKERERDMKYQVEQWVNGCNPVKLEDSYDIPVYLNR